MLGEAGLQRQQAVSHQLGVPLLLRLRFSSILTASMPNRPAYDNHLAVMRLHTDQQGLAGLAAGVLIPRACLLAAPAAFSRCDSTDACAASNHGSAGQALARGLVGGVLAARRALALSRMYRGPTACRSRALLLLARGGQPAFL